MSNIPPEPSDELINTVVSVPAPATHMRKFSFYQPVPDDWLSTEDDDVLEAFCLFCHRSILSALTSLVFANSVLSLSLTWQATYYGPPGPVTLSPIKVPANGECRRVSTLPKGTLFPVPVVAPQLIPALHA